MHTPDEWAINAADGLKSKLEINLLDGPADYDDLLLAMLFLPSGDCILIQVFLNLIILINPNSILTKKLFFINLNETEKIKNMTSYR